MSQNPTKQAGPFPEPWRLVTSTLEVNVETSITRDELLKSIDRILALAGCPGCGLLGFDLHLLGSDPLPDELQGLPGIKSVRQVSR